VSADYHINLPIIRGLKQLIVTVCGGNEILLAIIDSAFYTRRPAENGSFRASLKLAYFLSSDLW